MTNNGTRIPLDQAVTLTNLNGLLYTSSANQGTDVLWLKDLQRQLDQQLGASQRL